MRAIQLKYIKDDSNKPSAVLVSYRDWLVIESQLGFSQHEPKPVDLSSYSGSIEFSEDPLEYQKKSRDEWS